jgi:uncharacterized protein YqiB (DUF1249 family)
MQLWTTQLHARCSNAPNFGALLDLGRSNYLALHRLVPGIASCQGTLLAGDQSQVVLQLEILEQSRYCTFARLTHVFDDETGQGRRLEPGLSLRIYHDARQLDVVGVAAAAFDLDPNYQWPSLLNKWRAQMFLYKWLQYCGRCLQKTTWRPVDNLLNPSSALLSPEL